MGAVAAPSMRTALCLHLSIGLSSRYAPGLSEIIPQFTPALFNLLFLHIEQIASSTLKMYNAPGMSCYCVILGANSDVFVTKFSSLQP